MSVLSPSIATLAPDSHPCFNGRATGRHGRLHLPVAATCNIGCRYCNRRHDCANESRPGVSSTLLTPHQAATHVDEVLARMPWISVAGIAGPGDAFAEPQITLATLEAVRRRHPKLHLCLSTNGLAIAAYIPALVELKVGFVTVTVNTLDPATGALIYGFVLWEERRLVGQQAAELLLTRQQEAISRLASAGILVKIKTVVIPGINTGQCQAIARTCARLGAVLHNLIPIIPVPGTALSRTLPPTAEDLTRLRRACQHYLPQMHHCMRCRADSSGLLTPFAQGLGGSAGPVSPIETAAQ